MRLKTIYYHMIDIVEIVVLSLCEHPIPPNDSHLLEMIFIYILLGAGAVRIRRESSQIPLLSPPYLPTDLAPYLYSLPVDRNKLCKISPKFKSFTFALDPITGLMCFLSLLHL